MKAYALPKVFALISEQVFFYETIKTELRSCGFEIEGLLSDIPRCELIVLDYGALQLDIVNYLNENKIKKPVVLILTEMQMYSAQIQSPRIFQEILVIRDLEECELGEHFLRTFFEKYLPAFNFSAASKAWLSAAS